jgi:hypothetical protein
MKKEVLLWFFLSSLMLINGCNKDHSLENGNGPSEGTLQDDGSGDCLPKTVAGAYVVNIALVGTTNYIEVEVNVTSVGAYIIHTDTVNGMHFSTSGVFSQTGLTTIRLKGNGTPLLAETDDFTVQYGTSACTVSVTTVATLAVFTLSGAPDSCMNYVVAGTYTVGTPLTTSNTATINVNVTTAGAYSITTTVSNGIIFSGSGTLSIGAQTIVLTAAGSTPTTGGITTIPVMAGSTACSFKVNVGNITTPATYTINCTSAAVNGTYTVNTALSSATNTISLSVNVAVAGSYTITGTINNMTFTGSGTFVSAGAGQSVTLTGSGTPNTAGANIVPLTGGTAACNVTVNVNPAGGGVAVFTVNCSSATVNGTYIQNTALTASNTVTLNVNVTTAGTYNITTTATNGMTFNSGAGTWTLGAQTVTLTGTGTPAAAGTIFIPVTAGTTPCNFLILVSPPAAGSDYFPRTTNSNWSYEIDDVSTDSSLTKVIAATHTALSNTYNVFMSNDGTGFDTSGYYRKSGNDYYHYVDLAGYLGVDSTQRVEFIFLKDNQATGFSWTTAAYTNSAGGTPLTFRIKFTIINPNATVSITSLATGTISYSNTIIVEEHYEADLGAGFVSLDNIVGYYRDYYSKNIGWIKDEYIDQNGNPGGTMELRRYVVY